MHGTAPAPTNASCTGAVSCPPLFASVQYVHKGKKEGKKKNNLLQEEELKATYPPLLLRSPRNPRRFTNTKSRRHHLSFCHKDILLLLYIYLSLRSPHCVGPLVMPHSLPCMHARSHAHSPSASPKRQRIEWADKGMPRGRC